MAAAPEPLRISELAALHFSPSGTRRSTVVMSHGFSMTMRDGLEPYARAFAEAGHEVLAFDPRFLGESGGEPRQRFRIAEQLDDWRAAIAYARSADGLGATATVVWGFSMGGGNATTIAAEDRDLAAAILLFPFVSGFGRLRKVPLKHAPFILPRAIADRAGRHNLIPVTAPPGEHAAMNFAGEYDGFIASRTEGSKWRNEISPGVFATVVTHRPYAKAAQISCPVWAGIGERDITVPGKAIERLAKRAPQGELHRYDSDHFEPFYKPDLTQRIAADQVEFLARVAA
jgi:pimeloyl-ACP methyl ester carboxylesterase